MMLPPYGTHVPYQPDANDANDVEAATQALLRAQFQAVLDDPVARYCLSSIWNRRIWDYLIDTATITYRLTP